MISVHCDYADNFIMQKELDDFILESKNINLGSNVAEYKTLDLIDEIAELMNKTRCHKYWTNKPAEPKEVLLEEYVDGWHFLFSIGNDISIGTEHYGIDIKGNLRKQFSALFLTANTVYTPIGWTLTVSLYKGLGQMLGFTETEVFGAYLKKYKINIQRQKEGY